MNDKSKMIVALVCLVLAGVVVAWQLGAFKGGAKGATNDNETYADEIDPNAPDLELQQLENGMSAVNIGGPVPMTEQ